MKWHRQRQVGFAATAARPAAGFERCLWGGDFVDEVAIDEDQRRTVIEVWNDMVVPIF
jgi:hypothetical protein